MQKYNPEKIEKKWQKEWERNNSNAIDKDDTKKKFYLLGMFPYPSGDGLHMGHAEAYTAGDIFARYKKAQGFNVLHPMGFDSFGLPAENYAIKTKTPPQEVTKVNSANFTEQFKSLGINYDFSQSVTTSNPDYYRWTQWLFIQFFKNDFVYKKTATANWCESCKTILANEQVESGACERCKEEVIQKPIPSWFFKTTAFAEDLINGHKNIDWPEATQKNQINWIGKSEGAEIEFELKDSENISVFTTRPDTLFGATYMVLAPEHPLVAQLLEQVSNKKEVQEYIDATARKTDLERTVDSTEKTGVVLEGITATNPASKEEIPIYIADYVLAHYGTGAIMAVPGHDERDFAFAKKFNISIQPVVEIDSEFSDEWKSNYSTKGTLMNSGEFDGLTSDEGGQKITEFVGGKMKTTYKLRDWSISRQRYWGTPIPIVYDPEGVAHTVPEEHLPWLLPEDVDFVPTGEAPLSKSKELLDRTEKIFGKGWTPEVDTMDTFVCSAWYYLRYPDPHNEEEFCSTERLKKWLPVDLYIGGAEHTYLHLLYARFFTKALHKIGLLDFDEPFPKLRHQGMLNDEHGVKMSKSKGNVINPDDMIERFGADAVRMYLMFAAPLADEIIWNENGIVGTTRFLERVWRLREKVGESTSENAERALHKLIKKVGEDIENLKYNTAISAMMSFLNKVEKEDLSLEDYKIFLKLLAPFAPHITEELWEGGIHGESWPVFDEALIHDDTVEIMVQFNGKTRTSVVVASNTDEETVITSVHALEGIEKWMTGEPKRIIFVEGRLINFVV